MSTGRAAAATARLYELRTYSLRLEQVGAFLRDTERLLQLRITHSPVLGYWAAELGGLHQVVHVWPYDSLAHRAKVRASLAADTEWAQKYVVPVVNPAVLSQDNLLMQPIDGTTVTVPTGKGVTELLQFSLRGPAARWQPVMLSLAASLGGAQAGSALVGCFRSLVGPGNTAVLLLHHPSQDALLQAGDTMRNSAVYEELLEHVQTSHSKMLLPQKVSVIQ